MLDSVHEVEERLVLLDPKERDPSVEENKSRLLMEITSFDGPSADPPHEVVQEQPVRDDDDRLALVLLHVPHGPEPCPDLPRAFPPFLFTFRVVPEEPARFAAPVGDAEPGELLLDLRPFEPGEGLVQLPASFDLVDFDPNLRVDPEFLLQVLTSLQRAVHGAAVN